MAARQLETALELYFVGTDLYSVITLSGAADEVFGQVLRSRGQEPELENLKRSVAAIYKHLWGEKANPKAIAGRANYARNSLKHWAESQPLVVEFDLPQEAKDMLERAIANYWAPYGDLTPAMERFETEARSAAA